MKPNMNDILFYSVATLGCVAFLAAFSFICWTEYDAGQKRRAFVESHNLIFIQADDTEKLKSLYAEGWQYWRREFSTVTLVKERTKP